MSDFSLIDAIESGIVKIPRVPVDDDVDRPATCPTYRDLWLRIRDDLPKRAASDAVDGSRHLPKELEGALQQPLRATMRSRSSIGRTSCARIGETPPVFIVVCHNTDRLQARLRLDRGLGEAARRTATRSSCPASSTLFSNVVDGRAGRAAEHASSSTRRSSSRARR